MALNKIYIYLYVSFFLYGNGSLRAHPLFDFIQETPATQNVDLPYREKKTVFMAVVQHVHRSVWLD